MQLVGGAWDRARRKAFDEFDAHASLGPVQITAIDYPNDLDEVIADKQRALTDIERAKARRLSVYPEPIL